jgi:hypothetical protein
MTIDLKPEQQRVIDFYRTRRGKSFRFCHDPGFRRTRRTDSDLPKQPHNCGKT